MKHPTELSRMADLARTYAVDKLLAFKALMDKRGPYWRGKGLQLVEA